MVMNNIGTISREFGSGGRELGKRLAEYLDIYYFDREILARVAREANLDVDYVEEFFNKGIAKNFPITIGGTFSFAFGTQDDTARLFREQQEIIKKLAAQGDCVIVGRNADLILEDQNPFKIFVYSDMESKMERCRERASEDENLTDKELKKKIIHMNKSRAEYHDIMSDIPWGDKSGYNLCINTDDVEIKEIVPYVGEIVKTWFRKNIERCYGCNE